MRVLVGVQVVNSPRFGGRRVGDGNPVERGIVAEVEPEISPKGRPIRGIHHVQRIPEAVGGDVVNQCPCVGIRTNCRRQFLQDTLLGHRVGNDFAGRVSLIVSTPERDEEQELGICPGGGQTEHQKQQTGIKQTSHTRNKLADGLMAAP